MKSQLQNLSERNRALLFVALFTLHSCKCAPETKSVQESVQKSVQKEIPAHIEKLNHKQFIERMREAGWMKSVSNSLDPRQLTFINEIERLGHDLDRAHVQSWKFGSFRISVAGRLLIDVEVNQRKVLMYRSTGKATKREGHLNLNTAKDWVPLPGIAEDGWFIKGIGLFGAQQLSQKWTGKLNNDWQKFIRREYSKMPATNPAQFQNKAEELISLEEYSWSKIDKYGSTTFRKIAEDLKVKEKILFKTGD